MNIKYTPNIGVAFVTAVFTKCNIYINTLNSDHMIDGLWRTNLHKMTYKFDSL